MDLHTEPNPHFRPPTHAKHNPPIPPEVSYTYVLYLPKCRVLGTYVRQIQTSLQNFLAPTPSGRPDAGHWSLHAAATLTLDSI